MGKVTITDEVGAAGTPADGVTLYSIAGVLYYIDDGGTIHEFVTDNNVPLTNAITTAMLQDDAVTADKLASDAVVTASIVDDAVTLAKMANITRGSIIVGGAANAPTLLDANDSGKILIGDGTDLKSVAISGDATLAADGTLTVASSRAAGYVWDPLNNVYGVNVSWDGRTRWIYPHNMSIVASDANNPFGGTGKTLRVGTLLAAGKVIFFDEVGLQPGEQITASAMVRGTASDTWRLTLQTVNAVSGGSVVTTATGATTAMTGNVQTLSTTITPGAGSVRMVMFLTPVVASNPLNVYAQWIVKGSAAGTLPPADPFVPPAQPNVMPDPLNQLLAVGASINGRARFANSANMSLVTGDDSHPYGATANILRIGTSSTYGSKIVYCDEAGLAAGDEFQCFAYLVGPAAGTVRMTLYCMSEVSGGTIIASPIADFSTDGSTPIVVFNTTVLPEGTKRISVYITRQAGTTDIDVYGWWGGKAPQPLHPPGLDYAVLGELLEARGSLATLDTRLSVSLNDDGTLRASAVGGDVAEYGAHRLRNWRGQIAKIQNGTSAQARLALLGDSWIAQNYLWLDVQEQLQDLYGDGGRGYMSAGGGGYGLTITGTWTTSDEDPASRGIDATHRDTTDTATPAKISLTTTFTDLTIHYIAKGGNGEFRYRVDAGGWTTVNTDNGGTEAAAFTTLTPVSDASHTFELEILSAGSNGIRICGLDATRSGNNVIVHRLGNSGGEAQDIAEVDATMWEAQLTELNPTALIILFGTNECQAGRTPATFNTHLTTLITRARTALPLIDIVLFSPGDNDAVSTYGMDEYDAEMLTVAQAQSCTYLSGYQLLPDYDDSVSRALMADTVHPNSDGYMMLANALVQMLTVR